MKKKQGIDEGKAYPRHVADKNQKFFFFVRKIDRLKIAIILVAGFSLISLCGVVFPPFAELSAKITNRKYNGEGLIEIIEAICWLLASITFFILFLRELRKNRFNLVSFWYVFFGIFCFVAFGEEISWGQHIFGFVPSDNVAIYNKQSEYNIHNLNISLILGINPENPLYWYFQNITRLLNPLFYLICSILWFVIPLLRWVGKLSRYKFVVALPLPSLGTVLFCGINILAFLVIDKIFFDFGEIFELSWALVALMVPLDVLWPQGSFKSLG